LSRNIEDGNAGAGSADFARLVDAVSRAAPEVRVRFTSPHPKDFPPHLIELIAERESCSRHSIGGSPAGAGTPRPALN
jgi:tRNA-2-methylthio-N6-dimethylallyladenosine synthase